MQRGMANDTAITSNCQCVSYAEFRYATILLHMEIKMQ